LFGFFTFSLKVALTVLIVSLLSSLKEELPQALNNRADIIKMEIALTNLSFFSSYQDNNPFYHTFHHA